MSVIDLLDAAREVQDFCDQHGWGLFHRRDDRALDWRYIEEQLTPLAEAKEDPEIMRQFTRIRRLGATL